MRAAGALLAAVLGVLPALAVPGAFPVFATAPPLAATAESAATAAAITVAVSPAVVRPGEGISVTGSVVNRGDSALPAGQLVLRVSGTALERADLERGLQASGADDIDTVELGTVPLPGLPAGTGTPVAFGLAAPEVDALLTGTGWGAHLLTAELRAGGETVAGSASGFVWEEGPAPAAVGLVTVIPLSTPPGDAGLLDASELEAYTSPNGNLQRKLDAALGTPAVLALDPRIPASIRALGSTAPDSAVGWLRRLRAADNTVFPLQYADADPSLQRAAGAPALLAPISFESSIDPANFPDGTDLGGADGTGADGVAGDGTAGGTAVGGATPTAPSPATPTPAPTAPTTGVPTSEDLLDWEYDFTDLVWPTTVTTGDAAYWAASGYSRFLVPSASVDAPVVPPATVTVDGGSAIVIDTTLSEALSGAAFAAGEAEGRRSLADTTALLAASAADAAGPLVVALDRSVPTSTENLLSALTGLRSLPWVAAQALESLGQPATELPLREGAGADPRAGTVGELLAADRAIADFATVIERPELLTGRERLRLLALLSAQWVKLPEPWATAAADLRKRFEEVLNSVTITSSDIFAPGAFVEVPFYVENDLDYPVTLAFSGRPSNGRLLVEDVTATIAAASIVRVNMPAETIANGRVALDVQATNPVNGVPVGAPARLLLDVQAEWETVGLIVIGVLVAGLFGFGLFRNVRKRRKDTGTAA
ncbi:MAG: hypothetical protein JWP66_510 [Naasia sp.]|nr:hypothetical protein [Naasia sp.]